MDSLDTCPSQEILIDFEPATCREVQHLEKESWRRENSQIPKRNLAEKAYKQYETIKDNAI